MPEELKKESFTAFCDNSKKKITIRVGNTSVDFSGYCVLLAAHDEETDNLIVQKEFFNKKDSVHFKKTTYPFFALIYNEKHKNNPSGSFKTHIENLSNQTQKLPKPSQNPEQYFFNNNEKIFNAFSDILSSYNDEKNSIFSVGLLEFGIDPRSRAAVLTEVHDLQVETTRRKDLNATKETKRKNLIKNTINQINKFEIKENIKQLISFYHNETEGQSGESLFEKGITIAKEKLLEAYESPMSMTKGNPRSDADFEKLITITKNMIKKLHLKNSEYEQTINDLKQQEITLKNAYQFKEKLSSELQQELNNELTYIQHIKLLKQVDHIENSCHRKSKITAIKEEIEHNLIELSTLKKAYEIKNTFSQINTLKKNIASDRNQLRGSSLGLFNEEKFNEKLDAIENALKEIFHEEETSTNNFENTIELFENFKISYKEKITLWEKETTQFINHRNKIDKKLDAILTSLEAHKEKLEGKGAISLGDILINFLFKAITDKKIAFEKQVIDTFSHVKEYIDNVSSKGNGDIVQLKKCYETLDRVLENKTFTQRRSLLFFGFKKVTSEAIVNNARTLVMELKSGFKV